MCCRAWTKQRRSCTEVPRRTAAGDWALPGPLPARTTVTKGCASPGTEEGSGCNWVTGTEDCLWKRPSQRWLRQLSPQGTSPRGPHRYRAHRYRSQLAAASSQQDVPAVLPLPCGNSCFYKVLLFFFFFFYLLIDLNPFPWLSC